MRVVGVDPGLNVTGYGVLEQGRTAVLLLEGGVVRSARQGRPIEQRLETIYNGIAAVLDEFRPAALALEDLYTHRMRPATVITIAHARGVVCLAAAQRGVPVSTYTAAQVKHHLTGQGRATKAQVQRMVQLALRLPRLPEPPDVADALAVALYHLEVTARGWQMGKGGRIVDLRADGDTAARPGGPAFRPTHPPAAQR